MDGRDYVYPGRSVASSKASLERQHIFPFTYICYTKTLPSYTALDSILLIPICIEGRHVTKLNASQGKINK